MPVALSEVKKICTASELTLVRSSRKPDVAKLSLAEARKSAGLARKLFDKWQDQQRGQARTRSRKVGFGESDNRTQLKVQIFRETLDSFVAQIALLDKEGAPAGKAATGKPKKLRAVKHRATRAAVRDELADKTFALNAQKAAAQKAAAKKRKAKSKPAPIVAPTPAKAAPAKTASKTTTAKPAKQAKPAPTAPSEPSPIVAPTPKKKPKARKPLAATAQKGLAARPADQLSAAVAAKDSRMARSGKTTRMRGHVSAHGRRAQGRRDSKNG